MHPYIPQNSGYQNKSIKSTFKKRKPCGREDGSATHAMRRGKKVLPAFFSSFLRFFLSFLVCLRSFFVSLTDLPCIFCSDARFPFPPFQLRFTHTSASLPPPSTKPKIAPFCAFVLSNAQTAFSNILFRFRASLFRHYHFRRRSVMIRRRGGDGSGRGEKDGEGETGNKTQEKGRTENVRWKVTACCLLSQKKGILFSFFEALTLVHV